MSSEHFLRFFQCISMLFSIIFIESVSGTQIHLSTALVGMEKHQETALQNWCERLWSSLWLESWGQKPETIWNTIVHFVVHVLHVGWHVGYVRNSSPKRVHAFSLSQAKLCHTYTKPPLKTYHLPKAAQNFAGSLLRGTGFQTSFQARNVWEGQISRMSFRVWHWPVAASRRFWVGF